MGVSDWGRKAKDLFTSTFKLGNRDEQEGAVAHNPDGGSTGLRVNAAPDNPPQPQQGMQQQAMGGYSAYPNDFGAMQPPRMPPHVAQHMTGYPTQSTGYANTGFSGYTQGATGGYQPTYQGSAYDPNYYSYNQPAQPMQGYPEQQPWQSYAPQAMQQPTAGNQVYYPEAQQPSTLPNNVTYPEFPQAVQNRPTEFRITMLDSVSHCYRIIEFMRNGFVVVVNTEPIASDQEVQRCVDMISGAAFTLSCSVTRITRAERAYLIAPEGMIVQAENFFVGMTDQELVPPAERSAYPNSRFGSVAERYQQDYGYAPDRHRRTSIQTRV